LRFATTFLGATSTATLLVFALSAMAGELFNPFLFSPFALCPVLLFPLLPRSGKFFFGQKSHALNLRQMAKALS
ncbi:MAG: hypothetical protein O4859_20570, partial [Trichodesmium sp. St18_bin1]|nr:hypothetical protein [Trichodesmium sp. St18_bin1]